MDEQSQVNSRPSLRFLLLSHHSYTKLSHTFHVPIGRRNVYLCARCTGIVAGMILGLFYLDFLANFFLGFPWLIFVFTVPAAADWLLQVFKIRESNNARRVLTGSLIGQVYLVGIVALLKGWIPFLEFYLLGFAAYCVAFYAIFRKTRVMDRYMASSWPLN